MERPNPPPPRPTFFAAIAMIVIGLVIFVPSGLCTGVLFLGPLIEAIMSSRFNSGVSFVPLIIGGPFVFGGGFIVWKGIQMIRQRVGKPGNHPENEF